MVVVAYDRLCTFEFGIVSEVFGLHRPELNLDWYDFSVCSADPGPLHANGGITVNVDNDLGMLATADTVVIPGWRSPVEPPPSALLDAVNDAYQRGARLVSICSGVFVLAAAGLLDGRPATTHWRYLDQLASQHPQIQLEHNVLYVDDGQILTSAGSAAGVDLCLHIVRSDYGADVANQVARRLVVAPHREGGQAQYVPHAVAPDDTITPLAVVMEWALERLDQVITVADLAEVALMPPRTFARRFQRETGTTPHNWLTRERLHTAQRLLETTNDPVDRIAMAAGFNSPETLRHHFRKALATTPTSYRRRFSSERPQAGAPPHTPRL